MLFDVLLIQNYIDNIFITSIIRVQESIIAHEAELKLSDTIALVFKIMINNFILKVVDVAYDVPRGCHCGLILFNLFINYNFFNS